jgi:hypothetical protein
MVDDPRYFECACFRYERYAAARETLILRPTVI